MYMFMCREGPGRLEKSLRVLRPRTHETMDGELAISRLQILVNFIENGYGPYGVETMPFAFSFR